MQSLAKADDFRKPDVQPKGIPAAPVNIPQISVGAFCETPGVAEMLERAAADRRMTRARVAVRMGGLPAATELYGKTATPNLIIIESQADENALLAGLDALAEFCLTSTKVVVVGHRNDVSLYRELLQRGVSDYVVAPVDVTYLLAVVARLYRGESAQKLGRICAFVGARGGAGSSTIAHNTAWTLAHDLDTDVLLTDADLPFGTAGLDFNLDAAQGTADAIRDGSRLDEMLLERLVTKRNERLSILTPPAALDAPYDLKESDFDRLVDTARSSARLTVLDLPHMWTSWVRRILAAADEVVITAVPDLANMRNTKGILEFARKARPNDAPPKLVLNQVGVPKRPEIKPAAFAAAVQIEPVVSIPFEPLLFGTASNNGQMIRETSAKTPVAQSFLTLGQALAGEKEPKHGRGGLGGLAARLLGKR